MEPAFRTTPDNFNARNRLGVGKNRTTNRLEFCGFEVFVSDFRVKFIHLKSPAPHGTTTSQVRGDGIPIDEVQQGQWKTARNFCAKSQHSERLELRIGNISARKPGNVTLTDLQNVLSGLSLRIAGTRSRNWRIQIGIE